MKRLLILLTLLVSPLLFTSGAQVKAVSVSNDVCSSDKAKDSTFCKDSNIKSDPSNPGSTQKNPLYGPDGVLSTVIDILTAIVAIVAVIVIILAGFKFIVSGNNPQEVSTARNQIIYAVVALAIAALAQAVVRFIISKL